jgi:hypothetical protein
MKRLAAAAMLAALLPGCGAEAPPEAVFDVVDMRSGDPRRRAGACDHYNPERSAFFGDLHVHTMLSSDAYSFGVRVAPDGAYRYAFGQTIHLPLGEDPHARAVRIDRPLDFAAVTDHAEFLGEGELCTDPDSPVFDEKLCVAMRQGTGREPVLVSKIMAPISLRDRDVCGDDGERCGVALESAWRDTVDAAEAWNDRGRGCQRTTFPAYEYSSFRMGSNLHRNVIFRNAMVPGRPVSYLDAIREWDLWRILKQRCIDGSEECDVLAIPHNSNISNGRMFAVDYPGTNGDEERAARASLRISMEPVVEIMQHKGDSECRNGVPGVLADTDELCDFEKFENLAFTRNDGQENTCYSGPLADWVPHMGPDCLSPLSYVRYALVEGLDQQTQLGVNPFKLGIIASTDTHNGLAGGVRERDFPGHLGLGDATPQQRVQYSLDIPGNTSNNPGGLVGVWAEENSRDALFDAIRRKEVFGTSGPRIQPRFFGGWDLPEDLCNAPDQVAQAYELGVPMGGDLPERGAGGAPRFLAAALADAAGTPLQQLQVIKGWIDSDGAHRSKVFMVAGDPDNGAGVDLDTCATTGYGEQQLCAVWSDPAFEPSQNALYYLRVVENPSCRYSAWQCLELPPEERPQDCESPAVSPIIQERAWSSPIWYDGQAQEGSD